jgi:hypothetical protein
MRKGPHFVVFCSRPFAFISDPYSPPFLFPKRGKIAGNNDFANLTLARHSLELNQTLSAPDKARG